MISSLFIYFYFEYLMYLTTYGYQIQSSNKNIWFQFDLFFWVHFQFPLSTRFVQRSLIVCSPLRTWDKFFFFENIWSWRRILPIINHALRRWINASSVWLSHHYRVLQEWLKKNVCSFKVSECLSSQKNIYLRCLRIYETIFVSRLLSKLW